MLHGREWPERSDLRSLKRQPAGLPEGGGASLAVDISPADNVILRQNPDRW